MAKVERPRLSIEGKEVERTIEIDGVKSTLLVKLSFNVKKGQCTITSRLTTKQISRTPEVNAATLQQLSTMFLGCMEEAVEIRDAWGAANREKTGELPLDDARPGFVEGENAAPYNGAFVPNGEGQKKVVDFDFPNAASDQLPETFGGKKGRGRPRKVDLAEFEAQPAEQEPEPEEVEE